MQSFETLKQNYEFKRLYNRGKSFVSAYAVLYVAKGRHGKTRLGITAGKKLGCAVNRNRAKRVVRAAFSLCSNNVPEGYDFVVVARNKILYAKSTVVAAEFEKMLRAADLWCEL